VLAVIEFLARPPGSAAVAAGPDILRQVNRNEVAPAQEEMVPTHGKVAASTSSGGTAGLRE